VSVTVPANYASAVAGNITRPGYLVQISLPASGTAYLSTFGDVVLDGQVWAASDVVVEGVAMDRTVRQSATLTFPNTDGEWSSIAFGADDMRDQRVVIYAADAGGLTTLADALLVFDGVCDVPMMQTPPRLVMTLQSARANVLQAPRRRIAPPLFNFVMPANKPIPIGGAYVTLPFRSMGGLYK
jgi:hypothetical protein